MRRLFIGLFLLSLANLVAELSLIRVFDALFYPTYSYMIITSALFGFGLAGVFATLKPLSREASTNHTLSKLAIFFSFFVLLILPVMNGLSLYLNRATTSPFALFIYLSIMYLILLAPFFFAGLAIAYLVSNYSADIQSLYFSDLLGAAMGSIIIIPIIPIIGPGGLLISAAALGFFASCVFSESIPRTWIFMVIGISLMLLPILYSPKYFDFKEHQDKRGVKWARLNGKIEKTVWDPVSKIDVIDYDTIRYIAYDGGSQTSLFYPFDGDFRHLRENIASDLDTHFWQRGVLASHFLKRDTKQDVLIIGSAGGQEIKAALMYGAEHVDGVEMVSAVVNLGRNDYANYIGNLFQHPKVKVIIGEGRSFLRASEKEYDIIQIFSNYTSSSVAAGTGAMATDYLQTVEAYKEYFTHLSDNGILHINHFAYPRMVSTAAMAWSQLGRTDFQDHVMVFTYSEDETLPTFLVKMQPWKPEEYEEIKTFFENQFPGDPGVYRLVEDAFHPDNTLLSPEYYSGKISDNLIKKSESRVFPPTDNRPFFNFLDKSIFISVKDLSKLAQASLDKLTAVVLINITGLVFFFYGTLFILIPLIFSGAGRSHWPNKTRTLIYFSSLGSGFIIIEFVLIQKFMQIVGSPLHTYSTVIFVLLLSAGLGSYVSKKLNLSPNHRYYLPFFGILVAGSLLTVIHPYLYNFLLSLPLSARIISVSLLMFPLGIFMGMPFPLGILALKNQPVGAIAWAWGMNGLFTVGGGLIAIMMSIQLGFNFSFIIALLFYIIALINYPRIRKNLI
jgi:spermidine synthase